MGMNAGARVGLWPDEVQKWFVDLTPAQQDQARAMFFDAGPNDDRLYNVDGYGAGKVCSRKIGRFPEQRS